MSRTKISEKLNKKLLAGAIFTSLLCVLVIIVCLINKNPIIYFTNSDSTWLSNLAKNLIDSGNIDPLFSNSPLIFPNFVLVIAASLIALIFGSMHIQLTQIIYTIIFLLIFAILVYFVVKRISNKKNFSVVATTISIIAITGLTLLDLRHGYDWNTGSISLFYLNTYYGGLLLSTLLSGLLLLNIKDKIAPKLATILLSVVLGLTVFSYTSMALMFLITPLAAGLVVGVIINKVQLRASMNYVAPVFLGIIIGYLLQKIFSDNLIATGSSYLDTAKTIKDQFLIFDSNNHKSVLLEYFIIFGSIIFNIFASTILVAKYFRNKIKQENMPKLSALLITVLATVFFIAVAIVSGNFWIQRYVTNNYVLSVVTAVILLSYLVYINYTKLFKIISVAIIVSSILFFSIYIVANKDFINNISLSKANPSMACLTDYAKNRQINGYQYFWLNADVYFDQDDNLFPVRQNGKYVSAYYWLYDKNNYDQGLDYHYVINYSSTKANLDPSSAKFDALMREEFGDPDKTIACEDINLYYYTSDISKKLDWTGNLPNSK